MIVLPMAGQDFGNVKAEDIYPVACSIYEVSYIEDDGSFTKYECYDSFDKAKKKMQELGDDYVVRSADGYSPSKIVAINSGLVYSYPRGSSSTQNIYESRSDRYEHTYTYVSRYYEMTYIDTPYMSAISGFEGQGWVEVILNGFQGFADLEYTDLVPSKFIDKGIPLYMGGSYAYNGTSAYRSIAVPNYYIIKTNGNYQDLEFHYHISYPQSSSNACMQEYVLKVGSANDYPFLEEGVKYYSDDGINFYTDYHKTTYVGSAYNYYQYLPLRTSSDISYDTLNSFLISVQGKNTNSVLVDEGKSFKDAEAKYGCNATTIYAMACLESAYGTSGYARNRNNLFGWNAFDDSPDDASYFSSIYVCIKEQMGRNLRKFMDVNDGRYNGQCVGNKGSGFNVEYASDPYWGAKIASIYYAIDKYDNGNNGNLTDYGKYDLGLIETFGAKIYAEDASSVLYCSNYTSTRQQDHIVVLLEESGSYYKIQTSNPISDGKLVSDSDEVVRYDYDASVGLIKQSDVKKLTENEVMNVEHSSLTIIDDVLLDDGILKISGVAAITNMNFIDTNKITQTIEIYDYSSSTTYKEISCEIDDSSWFSINDGYDYRYAGFVGEIDLSELSNGSYYIRIRTTNGNEVMETDLKSALKEHSLFIEKDENKTYKVNANELYDYRFELEIMNSSLDYEKIDKPSIRDSLIAFDDIEITDEGILNVEGIAMIYYLDYSDASLEKISHQLYLVSENEAIEMNTTTNACSLDYQSIYGSSYNMKNICFSASQSIKELSGSYVLMIRISNGDYFDIGEIANRFGEELPSIVIDDRTYGILTDKVRYRLYLNVK